MFELCFALGKYEHTLYRDECSIAQKQFWKCLGSTLLLYKYGEILYNFFSKLRFNISKHTPKVPPNHTLTQTNAPKAVHPTWQKNILQKRATYLSTFSFWRRGLSWLGMIRLTLLGIGGLRLWGSTWRTPRRSQRRRHTFGLGHLTRITPKINFHSRRHH